MTKGGRHLTRWVKWLSRKVLPEALDYYAGHARIANSGSFLVKEEQNGIHLLTCAKVRDRVRATLDQTAFARIRPEEGTRR